MATPRQGTVTAKAFFTLSDLEMLFGFMDIPCETVLVLSLASCHSFTFDVNKCLM